MATKYAPSALTQAGMLQKKITMVLFALMAMRLKMLNQKIPILHLLVRST